MIVRDANQDDIPAIARVHVDTWRSAYQRILPAEYLANLSYEARARGWSQILQCAEKEGTVICVAENASHQVIGFACGGPERTGDRIYKGELMAIYILEPYHHQGIGRKLVRAIAERLGQANIHSMLVWVLVENPACQFYAALGGQRLQEKEIAIAGKSLVEVAYGWLNKAT